MQFVVAYDINIDTCLAVIHFIILINTDYTFQSTRPKHVECVDETNKTLSQLTTVRMSMLMH
jgi:hypothetical protein